MTAAPTATLDATAIEAFSVDAKVGLLATVDPEGRPHVSLITSIQARSPAELMWGQFCEGASKDNIRRRSEVAFLVMTTDRRIWRGKARWTGEASQGEEYVLYNRKPMFRYNSYFGIHAVHFMDLVEVHPEERLSVSALVLGGIAGRLALPPRRKRTEGQERPLEGGDSSPAEREPLPVGPPPLSVWSRRHLDRLETIKFLAWVGEDGFPWILPGAAIRSFGPGALALARAPGRRGREIMAVPSGSPVAVFALDLQTESVLVQGRMHRRSSPFVPRWIEIERVYNSMPPQHGQIYPPLPLEPVRSFEA